MGYITDIRKKIGHDTLLIAGAGIFVYQGKKVLMQKRRDNGCWSLHGGCVEIGECVETAAKRELLEETGLTANALTLLGVFSGEDMLYTYPNGDKVSIVGIYYVCNDFSGEMLKVTDETVDLQWFDIDHLPKNISHPDKRPLDAFIHYIRLKG